MRSKDNHVMVKKATPKEARLPNSRTFLARYLRVSREQQQKIKNVDRGVLAIYLMQLKRFPKVIL